MMWEPFTEGAREAIVRAQKVAQMFGSSSIGTEHLTFALAESDDEVGSALANAVDREAIRRLLGVVSESPTDEMRFGDDAKRSFELAFEIAHGFNHSSVGRSHLALGIIKSWNPPPLAPSTDSAALNAALELAATHETPAHERQTPGGPRLHRRVTPTWKRVTGDDSHPEILPALLEALPGYKGFDVPGTRVSVSIAAPDAEERTWSWVREGGTP
jgi:ATP-dependent Clp protease ATP-binding subunit ClpA